jgi:hypothetical protein
MGTMMAFRESVLAFSTGAAAGAFGTFFLARSVWQHAQLHGESIDEAIAELSDPHGKGDNFARRQVRWPHTTPLPHALRANVSLPLSRGCRAQSIDIPSLLDLRLRRELCNAWNANVMRAYESISRWL